MAEQIGTLAAMAPGPFVIQVGLGGGRAQFQAMGVRISERVRLLEEGIRVVQALLAGETVSSSPWNIDRARIAPLPPHGTEWWIGAAAPVALDRAARLGDCWYGAPELTPAAAAAALSITWRPAPGTTVDRVVSPSAKDVFVAETMADADQDCADPLLAGGYRGSRPVRRRLRRPRCRGRTTGRLR